ncbi:hypothetical protein Tsp_12003 [Trichinella spiralis]|uniref:hypothetical protein n=1 Tax=Trichinella spiralis TaxID=6334 RepID=UPI0001EFCF64|nr:hypothetical protein Tsp_12003 [Trichinella spiralis]
MLVTNTEIPAHVRYREMFNKHLVQYVRTSHYIQGKSCVMNFDFAHDNRCIAFFITKFVDKASIAAIVKPWGSRRYQRIHRESMRRREEPEEFDDIRSLTIPGLGDRTNAITP